MYIQIRNKQDNVSSHLVISKSRVAPITKVSVTCRAGNFSSSCKCQVAKIRCKDFAHEGG